MSVRRKERLPARGRIFPRRCGNAAGKSPGLQGTVEQILNHFEEIVTRASPCV